MGRTTALRHPALKLVLEEEADRLEAEALTLP